MKILTARCKSDRYQYAIVNSEGIYEEVYLDSQLNVN